MTPTIDIMQQHRSVRSYQNKPVDPAVLDAILDAAWKGPTSINGQQVSLVVTQDAEQRRQIAALAGGQPWIAQAPVFITIVIDFHKTRLGVEKAGVKHIIQDSLESFAVGAVDAGIALGNLMTAARSAGLGVVPIGGIRRSPQQMIELLQLPSLTFPVVGLALGHIQDDSSVKPRMSRASFVHHEQYQADALPALIDEYDHTLAAYWQSIGRSEGLPWTQNTAQYYQRHYFPEVAPVARKQGFGFDK